MFIHKGPVSRIVAIGDIHGDLSKAVLCAGIAGVVRADGSWRPDVSPNTVVVQLGDQIDGAPRLPSSTRPSGGAGGEHDCVEAVRGDIRVVDYFDDLDRQARAAGTGCRVYSLLGNHEVMNTEGFIDYADVCGKCHQERARNFCRGGAFAKHLSSTRHVCLVVGGVLFSHAGVLYRHLPALASAQDAMSAYLSGHASPAQESTVREHLTGPGGILCHRRYSPNDQDKAPTLAEVESVLRATGCNAMVLGHNAHRDNLGVTSSHEGRVWVVDPGMSSCMFDAPPCLLEVSVGAGGHLSVRTLRSGR